MTISAEKREMRECARARRAELSRALPDFAQRIPQYVANLSIPSDAMVAGYRALAEEADPAQLLEGLRSQGQEICYPRVHTKAHPLTFHVAIAEESWLTGAFGIPEPRSDWPRAFPSVLLVPLLAFDKEGNRLGYGGGYYDRTLREFRNERTVTAIGIAFAGQEVEQVPHDAGDEILDMVVTEKGIRRFSSR